MSPPSQCEFSPISNEEEWNSKTDENNVKHSNCQTEYIEPNIPDSLLQKMCKFQETSNYNINAFDNDDFDTKSINSYAALDDLWDRDSIHGLTTDEEDVEPGVPPPRKKLKTQSASVMFSNLVHSNFIYHATKSIILPTNLPKIQSLPFQSLPNVKFIQKPQFLANFSSSAPASNLDLHLQLQKLR